MARRKHGEGSVFQRKDGRWVAQVRLENGKLKSTYHKSEKEANVVLRKTLHEQEQGTLSTGPQQLLKVYLEQWLEQVFRPSSHNVGTYNMYRIVIQKHLIPSLGYIRLQKLTPQQVQAFYTQKLNEGLSQKRVKGIHSVLHEALENAVKWNLIGRNVCDLVNSPIPKRHEIQPLTQEQAQRLLKAAHDHKLEALLTVAVTTGMRRGELLGLHWQDINLRTGSLQVKRTVNRIGKYGLVVSEPKTARSRRNIVLPAFVIGVLKQHRERQQEMRKQAGGSWREMDIVFCSMVGGYIEPSNLQGWYKKLLKSAELPDVRFHDLRHSAATILLGMGVHPKVVQELLGHSSISMTMDVYSHVLPSMQQEAMKKLDILFRDDKE
ncbi:MAG: tyrosine-type recombinase/integrase [Ktedonobacteraceae bacterium]